MAFFHRSVSPLVVLLFLVCLEAKMTRSGGLVGSSAENDQPFPYLLFKQIPAKAKSLTFMSQPKQINRDLNACRCLLSRCDIVKSDILVLRIGALVRLLASRPISSIFCVWFFFFWGGGGGRGEKESPTCRMVVSIRDSNNNNIQNHHQQQHSTSGLCQQHE